MTLSFLRARHSRAARRIFSIRISLSAVFCSSVIMSSCFLRPRPRAILWPGPRIPVANDGEDERDDAE